MKTCRETMEFLRAYVDGDLPDGERAIFERHLESCPPCVNYLDSYRATIALARDACGSDEVPRPPDELVRAILDARKGRE